MKTNERIRTAIVCENEILENLLRQKQHDLNIFIIDNILTPQQLTNIPSLNIHLLVIVPFFATNYFNLLEELKNLSDEIDIVVVYDDTIEDVKALFLKYSLEIFDYLELPKDEISTDYFFNEFTRVVSQVKIRTLTRKTKKITNLGTKPDLQIQKVKKNTIQNTNIENVDLVVIGISTGGPPALYKMIPQISKNIRCPILIVLHMYEGFIKPLVSKLDEISAVRIFEAQDGDIPKAGEIYFAPTGKHMIVRKSSKIEKGGFEIGIIDTEPVNSCKPSVDVLFESVAERFYNNVVGIIMTGMGNDGENGTDELKKRGAYIIAQDKHSSDVWGMPQSIVDRNLTDEIIPLPFMAQRINQLAQNK